MEAPMTKGEKRESFVTHEAILLGVSVLLVGIVLYSFRKKTASPISRVEVDRLAALIQM